MRSAPSSRGSAWRQQDWHSGRVDRQPCTGMRMHKIPVSATITADGRMPCCSRSRAARGFVWLIPKKFSIGLHPIGWGGRSGLRNLCKFAAQATHICRRLEFCGAGLKNACRDPTRPMVNIASAITSPPSRNTPWRVKWNQGCLSSCWCAGSSWSGACARSKT